MNLEPIRELAVNKLAKPALLTKIHSPKILFAAGVAGVIGGVVLACRATLKVNETLDHHEDAEKFINTTTSTSDDEKTKELNRLKVRTAIEIVKPYVPAVILLGGSIAALTGSHVILTKRNTGLVATVAGLDQALKQYRQRVKDTYGEDVDREFAVGAQKTATTEKLADGSEKASTIYVANKHGKGSPYAVLFDEKSKRFTNEPGMIPHVLAMLQSQVNDRLRGKGFLYLNEVLEVLDLPQMEAGQHVGWIYTHDPKDNPGDNYISFGVDKLDDDFFEDWLDGHEKALWLDFNVAGVIHDMVSWGASNR